MTGHDRPTNSGQSVRSCWSTTRVLTSVVFMSWCAMVLSSMLLTTRLVAAQGADATQKETVSRILHNWQKIADSLNEFQGWICDNPEAADVVARNLAKVRDNVSGDDVNLEPYRRWITQLPCTYNKRAPMVNAIVRTLWSSTVNDDSLDTPGYTFWSFFEDVVNHGPDLRNELLKSQSGLSGMRAKVAKWLADNVEGFVDIKKAYLQSQQELSTLEGFRW